MAKLLTLLLGVLFLLALLVFSSEIVAGNGIEEELNEDAGNNKGSDGKGNLKPSQCAGECKRRCSRTHHRKPCLFFCNKCCAKCLCVPPGYYGNKETCPCYNNWKNKKGGPKCP
ncbi:hypothetical protein ACP70R_020362 [Stipagrostis hirtigluma subsp. patula]